MGDLMCCDFEFWSDGAMYCILYQVNTTRAEMSMKQDMVVFKDEVFSNMIFRHLQDDIVKKPTREIILPPEPVGKQYPIWVPITIASVISAGTMAAITGIASLEFPFLY
jgi:hypothetical protein